MEDMEEGGDEGEPENATPTSDSTHPASVDITVEAVADSNSSDVANSDTFLTPDPWARINELPTPLREKMIELREDK